MDGLIQSVRLLAIPIERRDFEQKRKLHRREVGRRTWLDGLGTPQQLKAIRPERNGERASRPAQIELAAPLSGLGKSVLSSSWNSRGQGLRCHYVAYPFKAAAGRETSENDAEYLK